MKRIYLAIILVLVCGLTVQEAWAGRGKKEPNKGYRFTLFIYGNTDTVMYLGNYYAGGTYAFDTARISNKGMFVFEDKEAVLKPGLYFFVNPAGTYVEFAVYNNEKLDFHFDTEEPGWQNNMVVKGSKENKLLFDFHKANRAVFRTIDSAKTAMTDSAAFAAFRQHQMLRLDSIKYAYIDNSRLEDDALVRTPQTVFKQRLDRYLNVYLKSAPPDIIIRYIDPLIDRAKPSKENFRYLVHTLSEKYLQSNVMSYDEIYVHLVKRYIEPGLCEWMSPSTVDMNVKRADTWEKLLIGRPAPPLIMKDDKGQVQSLYNLKSKYTLLIFWSPTCGHCKTIIPDLFKRYARYKDKYDIAAYAVLSEPDDATRPKWHEFIKANHLDWINIDGGEANLDWHEVYDIVTTPQIYLLDKDKKILAKKLDAETFEEVLKALEHIK